MNGATGYLKKKKVKFASKIKTSFCSYHAYIQNST